MMTFKGFTVNSNHNNQSATQTGTASCAEKFRLVHAACFAAVCTFIFALALTAIRGAIGVLISAAIIIGIIIILADNRIDERIGVLAAG